jgi:hypothetical protein
VNESDLRSSTGQLDSSSGEAGWLKRQTADSLMLASYDNLDKSEYGADWRSRRRSVFAFARGERLDGLGSVKANKYRRFSASNPAERGGNSSAKTAQLGARRVVLGLLVNDVVPRLTRSFRNNLETHLYALTAWHIGPEVTGERENSPR